jgi:glyceraldehyde-3-phosphate dehydrogenase/erythrose-4-phosphate dehydrogenase
MAGRRVFLRRFQIQQGRANVGIDLAEQTIEAVAPTSCPTATIAPNLDAFHAAFDIEEA